MKPNYLIALAATAGILGAGVAGCSSHKAATSTTPGASTTPPTSTTVEAGLPTAPPPNPNCQGSVKAQQDIPHPYLGTVRLFLVLKPSNNPDLRGCVSPVASNGKVLPVITITAENTENGLNFANPVIDSTGNAFITYNPGRYNGVLVLVPTPDGFENPGWETEDVHYSGKRAYYYAQLQGPGPDGK